MGRTYRFFLSGGISQRFFEKINQELPEAIDDPGILNIINFVRGQDESYFDIFFSTIETGDSWYNSRLSSAKQWLRDNQIEYEDITN